MSGLAVPAFADCVENGLTLTCGGVTEPIIDSRDGLTIELEDPIEITTSGPVGLSLTGDDVDFPRFLSDGTRASSQITVRADAGNGVELGNNADTGSTELDVEAAGIGVLAGDDLSIFSRFLTVRAGDDALQAGEQAGLSVELLDLQSSGGDALQLGGDSFLESNGARFVSTADDGAGIRLLGNPEARPSPGTRIFLGNDEVVGNTAIQSGDGVGADEGNEALFIYGTTLVGTGGTAVDLSGGDDVFGIGFDAGAGGASITGDVLLGSGDDVLQLIVQTSGVPALADLSFIDTTFDGGIGDDTIDVSDVFDLNTGLAVFASSFAFDYDGSVFEVSTDDGLFASVTNFESVAFSDVTLGFDLFVETLADALGGGVPSIPTDDPVVAPVPLPAAGWLLLAGLGGLGVARKRRQS